MSKLVRVKAPEAREGMGAEVFGRGKTRCPLACFWSAGSCPAAPYLPSRPWNFRPLCPGLPHPIRGQAPLSSAPASPPHQPSVPQTLFIPT